MAADGSVVISAKMNIAKAEKDLAKLKGKIEKTENDIAAITKKRDDASEKGALGAAQLDEEKRILAELKQQLTDLQAQARDKSLFQADRAAASAQIPGLREQVNEQKERVRALQSEWNKVQNSIDRYNQKISDANDKLAQQKTEAGQLADNIEAAKQAQRGFGAATAVAGEFADKLGKRIQRLASRVFVFTMITAALRSLRTWLGNVINTNDEARAAIARLQGALLTLAQPLVQVIIPAFTAFVNLLAAIVSRIAQFVSMIFGTTVKDSAKAAKGLNATAKGYGSVAKQAEKAAKSLAGFDEIEQLQAPEEADTGSGGGGGGGLGDIAPDFSFLDGVTEKLKKIADLVLLIAAGLALWAIGNKIGGPLGSILQLLGGILMTVGGVLLAWDGLTDAWENGVDWGNMAEMIAGVAAAAFGLYQVFMVLNPALAPIAAGIALVVGGIAMLVTGFHDAMENGWNLQNTLLSIAGILATGLGFFFITGSVIPLVIAGIAALLLAFTVATGHGEELIAGIQEVIQGFKDFFTGVFTGDMALAAQGITEIFDGMKQAIGAIIDGVKDFLLSFLDWLDEKTNGRFHGILEVAKGFVENTFGMIKTTIGNVINAIKQVFNGLLQFFTGVFTGDFDRAWEGIKNIFKGVWNGIVSILEGAVNLIIQGLNWLVDKINSISFTVPNWVPAVGGMSLSPNLGHIGAVSIPRLAQGAVIPANREFLAVLGDQRHGTNVEAPLSTIQEAVRVELQGQIDAMMAGFEAVVAAIQNKDMDVYIGDESIGRAATRYQDRMSFIGGY